MKPKYILERFASTTTMHGVPKVILARSPLTRCFWSVVCITAGAIFCVQMTEVLRRFFSYPKKVTVEVVSTPVPFPSISLCNMRNLDVYILNTIYKLFLKDHHPLPHINTTDNAFIKEYMTIYAKYDPLWYQFQEIHPVVFQEVFSRTTLSANIPEEIISTAAVQLEEFIVTCYFGGKACNRSTDFKTFFDPYYFNCFTYNALFTFSSSSSYTYTSASSSSSSNHPAAAHNESSNDTEYYSDEADYGDRGEGDNITQETSTDRSHHPFEDDEGSETDELLSLSEGIENGWSAIVLTGSGMLDRYPEIRVLPGIHESRSAIAASEGVRVVIHPPDTQPFPFAEGFDVPPGYSASFGIRPRQNIRIGPPHGNCKHSNPFEAGSPNEEEDGTKEREHAAAGRENRRYRGISCQKLCIQSHVIRKCKCYDASLPLLRVRGEEKPCRRNDEMADSCMWNATRECLDAMLSMFARIQCARETRDYVTRNTRLMAQCQCHQPCDEFLYDVSYSLSKWPASGYEGTAAYLDVFFIENFRQRFEFTEKNETVWNYFKDEDRETTMKDFSRLNVYVADSNVIKTQETPDYEPNQLVSDIGGQLGIWVGISVITLSEVIELFCFLMRHCLSAKRRYPTQTNVVDLSDGTVVQRSLTAATMTSSTKQDSVGLQQNGYCGGASNGDVGRRMSRAGGGDRRMSCASGDERFLRPHCSECQRGRRKKKHHHDHHHQQQISNYEQQQQQQSDQRDNTFEENYKRYEYSPYLDKAPEQGYTFEPIERDRSAMFRTFFSEPFNVK